MNKGGSNKSGRPFCQARVPTVTSGTGGSLRTRGRIPRPQVPRPGDAARPYGDVVPASRRAQPDR